MNINTSWCKCNFVKYSREKKSVGGKTLAEKINTDDHIGEKLFLKLSGIELNSTTKNQLKSRESHQSYKNRARYSQKLKLNRR